VSQQLLVSFALAFPPLVGRIQRFNRAFSFFIDYLRTKDHVNELGGARRTNDDEVDDSFADSGLYHGNRDDSTGGMQHMQSQRAPVQAVLSSASAP
jgi:hypothetical protein